MNLQEIKTLGVKDLSVSNGQAVAVNPYKMSLEYGGGRRLCNPDWIAFRKAALPPLPCHESVKEGTYPIGEFKEEYQLFTQDKEWVKKSEGVTAVLERNGYDTRVVLVLSEPVAETEFEKQLSNQIKNSSNQIADIQKRKSDDVAEKPEGESYEITFGNMLKCKVRVTNNSLRVEAAMDGGGNSFIDGITVTPEVWTLEDQMPPEAEPVESAEEAEWYKAEDILSKKTCYYPDEASTELGGGVMLFMEKDILDAMEEYAAIRVAQALKK